MFYGHAFLLGIDVVIVTLGGFFLSGHGKTADALQVADDTCDVVNVLAVAVRAFVQVTLVYMTTVVADGIGNVKGEIVATF